MAIELLQKTGSTACRIYNSLSLTRPYIKDVVRRLNGSRYHQVAFANIFRATRFKFFGDNRRYSVKCFMAPNCKEPDSFEQLTKCADLGDISEDPQELCNFIIKMVFKAAKGNPGYPGWESGSRQWGSRQWEWESSRSNFRLRRCARRGELA